MIPLSLAVYRRLLLMALLVLLASFIMAEFVLMALPPVRVWWVAFFVCMLVLMMMVDLYAMVLGGKFI